MPNGPVRDEAPECVHEWELDRIEAAGGGLAMWWRCLVCGAGSYEPSGLDGG